MITERELLRARASFPKGRTKDEEESEGGGGFVVGAGRGKMAPTFPDGRQPILQSFGRWLKLAIQPIAVC